MNESRGDLKWMNLQVMLDRIKREHPSDTSPINQYECPKCKDTGFIFRTDENGYEGVIRCECFAIRRAREMMKRSGISAEISEKSTFENFLTRNNAQLSKCEEQSDALCTKF